MGFILMGFILLGFILMGFVLGCLKNDWINLRTHLSISLWSNWKPSCTCII